MSVRGSSRVKGDAGGGNVTTANSFHPSRRFGESLQAWSWVTDVAIFAKRKEVPW